MKKISSLIIVCLHLVIFAGAFGQAYQPDWNSLAKHVEVPEWIRDAKFGIYTHWGVYTVPAYNNEQYYFSMHQDTIYDKFGTHKRQEALYGPLTKFGYHDFIPMFKGENFNADEWADLYKKSGARFAGTVAEHHDGFSMWDSKYTPFNAKNMGPKRDVVGELAVAIRKRGMKFFASLHHENNYTYVKPRPEWAASNPKYAKLYGSLMDHKDWLNMWQNKSMEVVDKYHPDIIYFDAWMDLIPAQYLKGFLAHYFNEAAKTKQEVIVTYKNEDLPADVGMLDHENSNPDAIVDKPWLCDYAIGTGFHYSWGYTEGMKIRTAKDIVHKLIEVVANNGQMILNLSPKADGTFPQNQKDVMADVGQWLWSFGDAIYGTRPFKVAGETVGDIKVFYTRNDKNVYVICYEWPATGKPILLQRLTQSNLGAKVKTVEVQGLKVAADCKFSQTNQGLQFTIPDKTRLPSDLAQVIKIELQ